jgi:DUF971 family protein
MEDRGRDGGTVERSGMAPSDVAVTPDGGVTVIWSDGHVTALDLVTLRDRCPCARCHQRRRDGEPVMWQRPDRLRIAGAELVGAWGLGLAWNDGHAAGVYEWDLLRSWCACGGCAGVR